MAEMKLELRNVEAQVTEHLGKLREPMKDALDHVRAYASEKPESAMLWCLGIGFVLGWKLKPW